MLMFASSSSKRARPTATYSNVSKRRKGYANPAKGTCCLKLCTNSQTLECFTFAFFVFFFQTAAIAKLSLEEDVSSNTAHYPANYFADITTSQASIDAAKFYTQGNYLATQHERAFGLVKSKSKKSDPHRVNPQSDFISFHDVFM